MSWTIDKGDNHLPRPNQLLDEDGHQYVLDCWEEFTGVRLHRSEDDHYLVRSWCDHPAQLAHAEWLIKQARRRNFPHFILGGVVYRRPMVPEKLVLDEFHGCNSILDQAKRDAMAPEELPPLRDLDFRFGCFGLPHGFQSDCDACSGCPSAADCEEEQAAVLERVLAETGSKTPAEERKRMLARERKRRQREREKAKASEASV